jgi:uncharacterized membrane protein YgaE (UPF0421/DUF939 family)
MAKGLRGSTRALACRGRRPSERHAGHAMKTFKEATRGNTFEFYEYIVKCLAGVTVGYLLLKAFPAQSGQLSWLLISILLSITHDNNSKAAYDRMRGNIAGSLVGLLMFLLHNPPNLLTVCIGVVVTITLCFNLDLISVCRTALVAFIIVMIFEETHSSWTGAIYRMVSVVLGCVIGLVINYTFRKITLPMIQKIEHKENHDDGGE